MPLVPASWQGWFHRCPCLVVRCYNSKAIWLQNSVFPQGFQTDTDSALIPCVLLICWLGITFVFRKGTSILQFIFLLFASNVAAFLSLVVFTAIVPDDTEVDVFITITLMILSTFVILLFFRFWKLIKSSPSFLFCPSTWVLPVSFLVLAYLGDRWGD